MTTRVYHILILWFLLLFGVCPAFANDPPVIVSPTDDVTTTEGNPLVLPFAVHEPDNDVVDYFVDEKGAGAVVLDHAPNAGGLKHLFTLKPFEEIAGAVLHGEVVLFNTNRGREVGATPRAEEIIRSEADVFFHTHKSGSEPSGFDQEHAVEEPGLEYVVSPEGVVGYNRDGEQVRMNFEAFAEVLQEARRKGESERDTQEARNLLSELVAEMERLRRDPEHLISLRQDHSAPLTHDAVDVNDKGLPAAQLAPTDFQLSSIQYLGGFLVPNGSTDQTSFNYGGTAIAYDPTSNGLFMTGHDWYQLSAAISIPQLVNSSSVNNLNTAALLQSFADATDGKISDIDPGSAGGKIGGMLVYNGKLITTAYTYYDASGNAVSSHFVSGLDLSNSADARGPFKVGTVKPGAVGGYMAAVPQDMQSLLGGPAVTGQCCIPIISRSSFGAALFAFDPDTLGVQNPAPATALVYYPNNQQPWNWDEAFDPSANPFNAVTDINGVFIDDTSQSVIFVGSQGLGTVCYKVAPCTNDGGYGVVPGSGGGSSDYVTGLWVYQASDLAKVKDGTLQPWQVRPSAWYQFDFPITGFVNVGGVAYDPATRRVFISQMGPDRGGGYGSSPVVQVYQLNGILYGDLNNDGQVTLGDVKHGVDGLLGKVAVPGSADPKFRVWDLNCNGTFDLADLLPIVKYLLGEPDQFPPEGCP